jgi:hypothetical protein
VGHGEAPQHERVDERERRRVRADAEREDEQEHGGEALRCARERTA